MWESICSFFTDFNSQPHKEADEVVLEEQEFAESISTHSLTRRLTIGVVRRFMGKSISTHSLTRRLTNRFSSFLM